MQPGLVQQVVYLKQLQNALPSNYTRRNTQRTLEIFNKFQLCIAKYSQQELPSAAALAEVYNNLQIAETSKSFKTGKAHFRLCIKQLNDWLEVFSTVPK